MAGFVRDWRVELIETYPHLFRPPAGAFPECGQGWQPLLDRCCARISAALRDGDRFRFTQVKEKFGTARLYWTGRLSDAARPVVEEAIDLAEARSGTTCETCGEEGRLHDHGGWLITRCALHAEGRPVESKPGFENLHLVHRLADGRLRTITCARYDLSLIHIS